MKKLTPLILFVFFYQMLFSQAGTIDSFWATDGHLYQDVLSGNDEINDAVVLPDGKIIACGTAERSSSNTQILVAQFMPDGSLDNSFGTGGYYLGDFPVQTAANAIGLADNGTVFVAGRYGNSADPQMFVAKLKPNGSLDSTFNFVGYDQVTFGGNSNGEVNAIHVFPGSNPGILIAGQVDDGVDPDMAVVKLFGNGNADVTFGTNAARIIDFRASDAAHDLKVLDNHQSDNIVVGASIENNGTSTDMAIARLNSDGTNDNSFSNDGRAFANIGTGNSIAYDVEITDNDQIILGGYGFDSTTGGQAKAIAVFQLDGNLDTTFNGTGIKTFSTSVNDFLTGRSLAFLSNDRILIA